MRHNSIIGPGPLRSILLLVLAVWISMGIFALVPLLLRHAAQEAHLTRLSHALLIPIRPVPPESVPPDQERTPPPEAPPPLEPEPEALHPDLPEMELPEWQPPDTTLPDMTLPAPDMPPLALPDLEPAQPEPPQLASPSLHAVSVSALPVQSSPLNLKVNLSVAKAPAPHAVARSSPSGVLAAMPSRYGLHEVDEKPSGIATLKPLYPYRARRQGIEGQVTVRFLVDQEGRTKELTIVEATPPGVFDQAVRETVPRWRFKPGAKEGKPVDTWVEMTIRFELGDNG